VPIGDGVPVGDGAPVDDAAPVGDGVPVDEGAPVLVGIVPVVVLVTATHAIIPIVTCTMKYTSIKVISKLSDHSIMQALLSNIGFPHIVGFLGTVFN
jgi:hypothetical protein